MATKLTLSMTEATVQRAKRIARRKGKSISRMVEEYFNSLPEKDTTIATAVDKTRQLLMEKRNSAGADWKKIKGEHLTQKYGI